MTDIEKTYAIEAQYEKILILKKERDSLLNKYNNCIINISKETEILEEMERGKESKVFGDREFPRYGIPRKMD